MAENPKLRVEQVSSGDRQLKVLVDNGLVDFHCNGCQQKLLCLQLTAIKGDTSIKVLSRVAVECGTCGSYSDVKQITGKFSPGAPSDDMIFDVVDGDGAPVEADVFFKAWKK